MACRILMCRGGDEMSFNLRIVAVAVLAALSSGMVPRQLAAAPILFTQGVAGNELWQINEDGTGLMQLLTMPSYIVSPRWSRDGSRIAFQSGTKLWIANAAGTVVNDLSGISVADGGLTWDSSGGGLVYSAVSFCGEYLRAVNADGSNDRLFYDAGPGTMFYPDARPGDSTPSLRVAYLHFNCSGGGPFGLEMTREGGAGFQTVPLESDVFRQQYPRWSRDSAELLTAIELTSGDWALEILDPFSSASRTRLLAGPGGFSEIDWGNQYSAIFFARESDGFRDLWRVNRDGTGLTQLTHFSDGFVRGVDVSPVPEPATLILFGSGVLVLLRRRPVW
jgi:hypothetical protein